MRNPQVDAYMEQRFGEPDFTKSFIKEGMIWTPMGDNNNLWRIDKVLGRMAGENETPMREIRGVQWIDN